MFKQKTTDGVLISDWSSDVCTSDLQLHVQSPVLNALAAQGVARRRGVPMVYEIRAYREDAAVGNGTGREGSLRYRLSRALETRAARRADAGLGSASCRESVCPDV